MKEGPLIVFCTARATNVAFLATCFFSRRCGGSSTQAWMPTYVSILRIPQMIWVWIATVEWYWQGKTEELGEKNCPSVTMSTTNPTCIDPGANPGLRGERPTTNDLSLSWQLTCGSFLLYQSTLLLCFDCIWFPLSERVTTSWTSAMTQAVSRPNCGGPGSCPGQSMWNMWWIK
jgi:hypothetical protein